MAPRYSRRTAAARLNKAKEPRNQKEADVTDEKNKHRDADLVRDIGLLEETLEEKNLLLREMKTPLRNQMRSASNTAHSPYIKSETGVPDDTQVQLRNLQEQLMTMEAENTSLSQSLSEALNEKATQWSFFQMEMSMMEEQTKNLDTRAARLEGAEVRALKQDAEIRAYKQDVDFLRQELEYSLDWEWATHLAVDGKVPKFLVFNALRRIGRKQGTSPFCDTIYLEQIFEKMKILAIGRSIDEDTYNGLFGQRLNIQREYVKLLQARNKHIAEPTQDEKDWADMTVELIIEIEDIWHVTVEQALKQDTSRLDDIKFKYANPYISSSESVSDEDADVAPIKRRKIKKVQAADTYPVEFENTHHKHFSMSSSAGSNAKESIGMRVRKWKRTN